VKKVGKSRVYYWWSNPYEVARLGQTTCLTESSNGKEIRDKKKEVRVAGDLAISIEKVCEVVRSGPQYGARSLGTIG